MEEKMFTDKITEILKKLQNSTYGIESVVLSNPDGIPMASLVMETFNDEEVSSQSSAAIGVCERTLEKMKRKEMEQVYMKGTDGKIYVFQVQEGVTLTVITTNAPKTGMVLFVADNAVKAIRKVMDEFM